MKVRARLIAAVVVLAPMPALAADHLMKVGEVLLSNGGSTTSQFLELEDPGESFPAPPYSIEIYDAAGASVGSQLITVPSQTTRFLLATTQAQTDFSVTANVVLTVALPTNGQACFKRSATLIHCLAWGTITTAKVGSFGSDTGASPGDGLSLQRTTGYMIATPTPGAANVGAGVDGPLPDAGVLDSPLAGDASPGDAGTDAPDQINPIKDDDDGCSVGANASWFGLLLFASVLIVVRRRSTRR